MAKIPMRKQAGEASGAGSSGDNSHIGPEQGYGQTQGQAPGGKSLGDDLPVSAVPGGMPFTEGFTPNNEVPPLPDPWDVHAGVGKAPSGNRR